MSKGLVFHSAAKAETGSGGAEIDPRAVASLFTRAKEYTNTLRNSVKRIPVPANAQTHRTASVTSAPTSSVPSRSPTVPEKARHPGRNIGVTLTGIRGRDLGAFLDSILMVCAEKGVTPVFLTDVDDFSAFRERGLAFEHLPSRETIHRFGQHRDWQTFTQRRLDILKEKWGVDGFVSFGNEDGTSLSAPVGDTSEFGFWQRQVLRLFRIALRNRVGGEESIGSTG